VSLPRLGLFGGTFDPPHLGHVAALHAAAASGRFDVIEVTVAGDPYQKSARGAVRPAAVRLAMAHAAFGDLPLVVVSDREIRRQGPSYTIDTVREERGDYASIDLIVGADLLQQLPTWHDAADLARLVRVGVVPRPGSVTVFPDGWECYELPMEPVDLSSTFIREMADGDLSRYVPAAVIPLFDAEQG
jgi:nicotinate-nucleotide adenylyltransferase